jgi:glycosyltransferase involved in cell wall biosynthesis
MVQVRPVRPWRTGAAAFVAVVAVDQVRRASARREGRRRAGDVRAGAVSGAFEGLEVPGGPPVVVVMSALNEAETVGRVLAALPQAVAGVPLRAVVVDDASTDGTAEVAARAGAVVAVHRRNLGQGDGLRTGFEIAAGIGAAVVVTMDADGQHDPVVVSTLVEPILRDEADYVQGSRFLGEYDDAGGMRHVGIRGFTALINVLARTQVTDCANGYRAIRGSGLARMRLVEDRFSASEIIIEAAAAGLRMREIPVHVRSRDVGESRKPRGLGYPMGYLASIIRSWGRATLRRWLPRPGIQC